MNDSSIAWQDVLRGSERLNAMKRNIDTLLNILKGLAKRADTSERDTRARVLLWEDGQDKFYLVLSATGVGLDVCVSRHSPAGFEGSTDDLQASQLSPEQVVLLHNKLHEVLGGFLTLYPTTVPHLAFIANQA